MSAGSKDRGGATRIDIEEGVRIREEYEADFALFSQAGEVEPVCETYAFLSVLVRRRLLWGILRSLPEVLSSGSRHCPGLIWDPLQAFSKKLRRIRFFDGIREHMFGIVECQPEGLEGQS